MSAALLENIALLAASEGGVAKLRELILSLAVRGKLVPQDPADEPASELLKQIRAEKERLVAEGKIKREKALQPIGEEEKPSELPIGWEWVKLQTVYDVRDGTHDSPKYLSSGVPFLTSKNIFTGQLDLSDVKYISQQDHDLLSQRSKVDEQDILFAMIGSIGNPAIVNTDVEFSFKNMALFKYYSRALSSPRYLLLYLSVVSKALKERAAGGVQAFVPLNTLRNTPLPLPPILEQSRIVAKVEALMALCDRLEARQGDSARVQARWTQAVLDQLAESGGADEFARNWQALAEHFDTLFATPSSIDALDTTLLQLAVRGKLVPQNPADEPASELLKKIRAEKDRLIVVGKIKRDKHLPPIADDEEPFELPEGWAWARMQEVFDVRDGTHDTPKYVDSVGVPLITSRNFCDGRISFDDAKLISLQDHELIRMRSAVAKGDILYSMIGGNIGNQVMVDTDREFSIKNVALFKYYQSNITPPKYLNIFLRTVTISLQSNAVGGAQPFVSLSLLRNIPFPLPPTSEQSYIVAKLDELLALTHTLRARLTDARAIQARLASALVDEVAAC